MNGGAVSLTVCCVKHMEKSVQDISKYKKKVDKKENRQKDISMCCVCILS